MRERERERDYCKKKKNLFQLWALFGMKHKMHAFRCLLSIVQYQLKFKNCLCKRYLSTLLSCGYELFFLLLLVAQGFQWIIIKLTLTPTPFKIFLFFNIRQYLYWLFLLSSIIPIFQSLLIIALIMTNTMTCAMKREAWTWCLPSHLVPAKILCSRCEPCTNSSLCTLILFKYFNSIHKND